MNILQPDAMIKAPRVKRIVMISVAILIIFPSVGVLANQTASAHHIQSIVQLTTGQEIRKIATHSTSAIYVAGNIKNQTGTPHSDIFIRKYDLALNEVWTKQFGTSSSDELRGF